MKLTIPSIPPSVNHCYFTTPKGQRILTKNGKDYLELIQTIAKIEKNKQLWFTTKDTKVIVDLWFYFPDKRKRDTHNTFKILLDGLEGIIYDNDYFALPRVQDFQIDRENPRVEIEIREVS